MVAGHFATALVAKQHAPSGHLAFYLLIAQLPDVIWHVLHFAGLEVTTPANPMIASLSSMHADMTYSHDLLPTAIWVVLASLVGWALYRSWRVGMVAGGLVVAHTVCDVISGYPHHVFGPDSEVFGFGLYQSSPYLALGLEAVFTAAVIGLVMRTDAQRGVRRSRTTLTTWALVLGGGIALLLPTAERSVVELTGLAAHEALDGTLVPGLVAIYASMIGALVWADTRSVDLRAC